MAAATTNTSGNRFGSHLLSGGLRQNMPRRRLPFVFAIACAGCASPMTQPPASAPSAAPDVVSAEPSIRTEAQQRRDAAAAPRVQAIPAVYPIEYMVAPNEGHSVAHRENKVEFLTRMIRFLDEQHARKQMGR